jgi:hypothetical protein
MDGRIILKGSLIYRKGAMDWIYMTQVGGKNLCVVNAVMNLHVP